MDPIVVPILAAMVGAIGGVAAGILAGRYQVRLEREKWIRGISDAFTRELRSTIREFATQMAAAAHSMVWLCWLAKFGAHRLTLDRIVQYDKEMNHLLPTIMGLHAVIASMDYRLYDELEPVVMGVLQLDAQIGAASLQFVPGNTASADQLAQMYERAVALESQLSPRVANLIRAYADAETLERVKSR